MKDVLLEKDVGWSISFCLLAKVASGNGKPTSRNWLSTSLWLVGCGWCQALWLLTYIHVWNIDKNLFFNYSLYFDLRFFNIKFMLKNLNNVVNTMYSLGNTKIKLLLTEPQAYFLERGYLLVVIMHEIKMEIITRFGAVTNGWGWGFSLAI